MTTATEDESIAESFPASDPVSTHVPNGAGHEPHGGTGGTQVAERRSARTPVTLRTARRPSSTTATW